MQSEILFERPPLTWRLFRLGPDKPVQTLDANLLAVTAGGESVLIDPGGAENFPAFFNAVSGQMDLSTVRHIVLSHHDPDVCSSLALWREVCASETVVHVPWLWTGAVSHFDAGADLAPTPEEGAEITYGDGGLLRLIPAPYLPSSGGVHVFDPIARLLYSAKVGSALTPPEERAAFKVKVFDRHVARLESHQSRLMPSGAARDAWVERVRGLGPRMIVPQTGPFYDHDTVDQFITWFEDVSVGAAVGGDRSALNIPSDMQDMQAPAQPAPMVFDGPLSGPAAADGTNDRPLTEEETRALLEPAPETGFDGPGGDDDLEPGLSGFAGPAAADGTNDRPLTEEETRALLEPAPETGFDGPGGDDDLEPGLSGFAGPAEAANSRSGPAGGQEARSFGQGARQAEAWREQGRQFRLITRSDFDGLVCAVLLEELELINDILFVHPRKVQHGEIDVTGNDITTNLPFDSRAGIAFDHHLSEVERVGGRYPNHIINASAPSTARLVYEYFGGEKTFPTVSADMMEAVDRADSAQFTRDEILNPSGWALLNYIMDPRTGLDRFHGFRIPNYELVMGLIDDCRNHSIDEILAMPDVKERVDLYMEHRPLFEEQIKRCARIEGGLGVIDLRDERTIYAGNRFLVYALLPEINISMHVLWSKGGASTLFAVGKSIFDRSCPVNVGKIMLEFGGGGHRAAGTCQVENDEAQGVLEELSDRLSGRLSYRDDEFG